MLITYDGLHDLDADGVARGVEDARQRLAAAHAVAHVVRGVLHELLQLLADHLVVLLHGLRAHPPLHYCHRVNIPRFVLNCSFVYRKKCVRLRDRVVFFFASHLRTETFQTTNIILHLRPYEEVDGRVLALHCLSRVSTI